MSGRKGKEGAASSPAIPTPSISFPHHVGGANSCSISEMRPRGGQPNLETGVTVSLIFDFSIL